MDAKKDEPKLLEGERIILSSKRGGTAGYGPFELLLMIFVGLHVFGTFSWVLILLLQDPASLVGDRLFTLLQAVLFAALGAHWFVTWRKPAYFVTSKRLIARRFLRSPLSFELENIGAASRFVVVLMRHGRVVGENVTHRVALAFTSGGARRIGPVDRVEELMEILSGYLQGAVHPAALPGEHGEPSEAETRQDLFFASATLTGGVRRGPLFVGPSKIIAFASELPRTRLYQMLTQARNSLAVSDVEASMLSFAQSSEWGRGSAVVMDREGLTLGADEATLRVSADEKAVAFDLFPRDGKRLMQYLNDRGAHPYRG